MKQHTVSLGEACVVTMGQSPPGSSYNTSGDGLPFFQGKTDFGEVHPKVRIFCNQPSRIAENGDILMSVRAPVGPTNLAREKCCIGRGLAGLRPGKSLDRNYLLYFLRHDEARLASRGRGSTFDAINRDDLEGIELPLPSLPAQRQIAGRLDRADRLRRTRRYGLELTDTLLPAAFLELFGDPIENPRSFDHVELEGELQHIESGFSPVCEGPRDSASQWAVLGLGAVTTGAFKPAENKRLPDDIPPRPELEVKDGDLLVTRKNTYDLVAASVLVRKPPQRLLLPDTIFRFRLKQGSRLSSVFLWGLLSFPSFRKQVQSLASGSAGSMPGISKEKFLSVNCPVPPPPLQQKFAVLVDRVEGLRAVQREALRQAEHLFACLLDRTFRS